jgi:hypothetical protein
MFLSYFFAPAIRLRRHEIHIASRQPRHAARVVMRV